MRSIPYHMSADDADDGGESTDITNLPAPEGMLKEQKLLQQRVSRYAQLDDDELLRKIGECEARFQKHAAVARRAVRLSAVEAAKQGEYIMGFKLRNPGRYLERIEAERGIKRSTALNRMDLAKYLPRLKHDVPNYADWSLNQLLKRCSDYKSEDAGAELAPLISLESPLPGSGVAEKPWPAGRAKALKPASVSLEQQFEEAATRLVKVARQARGVIPAADLIDLIDDVTGRLRIVKASSGTVDPEPDDSTGEIGGEDIE